VTKGDSRRPGESMSLTQVAAMHGDHGDHSPTWQSESHGISQLHVNSNVHKAETQECYRNIFGYVILYFQCFINKFWLRTRTSVQFCMLLRLSRIIV
jgi:hypothetical protein